MFWVNTSLTVPTSSPVHIFVTITVSVSDKSAKSTVISRVSVSEILNKARYDSPVFIFFDVIATFPSC